MHFSDIIELQFGQKMLYIVVYFKLVFGIIVAGLSLQTYAWLPQIFLLVSNSPC